MKSQSVKTVHVLPVERTSPQGRHNQVYAFINDNQELIQTRSMKRTKEDNVIEKITFPRSMSKNKLLTGLDDLISNPFKGLNPDEIVEQYDLNSSVWANTLSRIVELDKIKRQTYYEILDGVDEDYYNSKLTYDIMNPNSYKGKNKDKTYLEDFHVILYPRPNSFSSDTPRGRLAIQVLEEQAKASGSKIAASKLDVNPSVHNWYLSINNEEEIEAAGKRDMLKKAMHCLYVLENDYTEFDAYKIATILTSTNGESLVKGRVSNSAVKSALDQYINAPASIQQDNLDTFISLFEEYKSMEGSERALMKYYVQQALNTGVLLMRDGWILWPSQKDMPNIYKLNNDINKVINFFGKEYVNYNPDDKETTNFFRELYLELTLHNVRVD